MEYSARLIQLVGTDGMKLDTSYFRSFKIGRLFYKYIKGTELEAGWTREKTEALALELEKEGFIKIVTVQSKEKESGRWESGEKRYVEVTGKSVKRADFLRMLKLGLLLILLLGGCGKSVEPRAVPYLEKFQSEAAARGISVDVNLTVEMDDELKDHHAVCDKGLFGNKIRLGATVPLDDKYRMSVEAVMFHELGHCVLGKGHVETDSIMNPTAPIHTYQFRRAEYLDEFFK